MAVNGIGSGGMIVGHKSFYRKPLSTFIVGSKRNNHPGNVSNLDVIISAEAKKLASHSTPLQKLQAGPTSALK